MSDQPQISVADFCLSHGIDADPPLDGQFHRYPHNCGGSKRPAWAKFYATPVPRGWIGCMRCGLSEKWDGLGRPLTAAEKKALREAEEEERAAAEKHQEEVAMAVADALSTLPEATDDTPYLRAKGVKATAGMRARDGLLFIPIVDVENRVWSAQGLSPTPVRAWNGLSKSNEAGGRIHACFFPIGDIASGDIVAIAEGAATGLSVHEATGWPVACALAANNLGAVAEAIRAKRGPKVQIVICGDNDTLTPGNPGATAARLAAERVGGVAALPNFKDPQPDKTRTDWNDYHRLYGLDSVQLAIEAALTREPEPAAHKQNDGSTPTGAEEGSTGGPGFRGTTHELPDDSDAARARQFVDRFAEIARYVPEWSRWLIFEGGRWRTRDDGCLFRLSCVIAAEILATCRDVAGTGKEASESIKRIQEAASNFANANRVRGMAPFAQADSRVIARPEDWDADPWLVGCQNGILDLRTGELTPHRPSVLVTRTLGCDFVPGATSPRWETFLERVLPDPSVREFVRRCAGYALTGSTKEHQFIFLHGVGANGKSTLLETLSTLLGSYAGRAAETLLYATDRGSTPEHVVAEIAGVRLLIGSETREGAKLNEGTVKDLTGGDLLRGARKYEHAFTFKPTAKLWIAGNHRPAITGTDHGIWRRVRLVEFPVQIPAEERDPGLPEALRAEMPGILNWMISGCIEWQRDGMEPPAAVRAASDAYREDEDVLGDFVREKFEDFGPVSTPHAEVFGLYRAWCEANGIRHPVSNRVLAKRLRDRGWVDSRGHGGTLRWRGVRVRTEQPPTDGHGVEVVEVNEDRIPQTFSRVGVIEKVWGKTSSSTTSITTPPGGHEPAGLNGDRQTAFPPPSSPTPTSNEDSQDKAPTGQQAPHATASAGPPPWWPLFMDAWRAEGKPPQRSTVARILRETVGLTFESVVERGLLEAGILGVSLGPVFNGVYSIGKQGTQPPPSGPPPATVAAASPPGTAAPSGPPPGSTVAPTTSPPPASPVSRGQPVGGQQ